MHTFIRVMCACYRILLRLYRRRLREAYGVEMVSVLREQMLDTLHTSGSTGALRAAGGALCELVTIAIPSRLNSEGVAVTSLAVCTSYGMLFALYRVVLNQDVLDPWMRSLRVLWR